MDAEQVGLRAQAMARVHEGAVRELAVRSDGVQREAQGGALHADRGLERLEQRVEGVRVLHGDEQLDRADGRPSFAVAALGADPGQPHGALDQGLGAQVAASTLRAPANSKRSYQPSPRSEERWRNGSLGRVEAAQIGGDRDRAPARIAVGEPAPDAVEDAARRVGEVQEHVFRRLGRLATRPPASQASSRALVRSARRSIPGPSKIS